MWGPIFPTPNATLSYSFRFSWWRSTPCLFIYFLLFTWVTYYETPHIQVSTVLQRSLSLNWTNNRTFVRPSKFIKQFTWNGQIFSLICGLFYDRHTRIKTFLSAGRLGRKNIATTPTNKYQPTHYSPQPMINWYGSNVVETSLFIHRFY